jgi:hypothetical protein
MPKKSLQRVSKQIVNGNPIQRDIQQLWRVSRANSGIPRNLTSAEQIYFVPVVVSVLRAHSRASDGPRRATASRAA